MGTSEVLWWLWGPCCCLLSLESFPKLPEEIPGLGIPILSYPDRGCALLCVPGGDLGSVKGWILLFPVKLGLVAQPVPHGSVVSLGCSQGKTRLGKEPSVSSGCCSHRRHMGWDRHLPTTKREHGGLCGNEDFSTSLWDRAGFYFPQKHLQQLHRWDLQLQALPIQRPQPCLGLGEPEHEPRVSFQAAFPRHRHSRDTRKAEPWVQHCWKPPEVSVGQGLSALRTLILCAGRFPQKGSFQHKE